MGTIVSVGGLNKYDVTAQVRLYRSRPGEPHQTLTMPMLWLEAADKQPTQGLVSHRLR